MLDGFGRCAGQFLLRKVKNRTVGEPFSVAFAALSHRDDVLGEGFPSSGQIVGGCPPSLALRQGQPLALCHEDEPTAKFSPTLPEPSSSDKPIVAPNRW